MSRTCARFAGTAVLAIWTGSTFSLAARAVTTQWQNVAGGAFTDPFNWTRGVPDDNDIALFNSGSVSLLPQLPASLDWNVIYTTNSVTLEVDGPGLPGDYNQNGTVDAANYIVWRKNLGSSISLPNDDTPSVGADDYTRWRTYFGRTVTAVLGTTGSASAAVPEPACATFVCFTMTGLWMKVRFR